MHRHVSKASLGNKFDDHKMIVRGRNHTDRYSSRAAKSGNVLQACAAPAAAQWRAGHAATYRGGHSGDAPALPRAPCATFSLLCDATRARNIARISPTYVRTSVFTVVASLEIKERGWSD